MESATTVGLLKTYVVIDQTSESTFAQKVKSKVFVANARRGSERLTLAWTTTANTVTLGVGGDWFQQRNKWFTDFATTLPELYDTMCSNR